MSLGNVLTSLLESTTTLDPRMAVLLFIVCAIGECVIGIPYVLESLWLLVGYQLGAGVLSPLHLAGLWLAAQGGRQTGAIALYYTGRLGSIPLVRFYHRKRLSRFIPKSAVSSRVINRINLSSPFSVAYGRLFGMRIPLTLTLAVRNSLRTLSMGVLLSSAVWDAIYISLGIAVRATAAIKPVHTFFISLAGVTLIYLISFLVRRVIRHSQLASDSVSHSPITLTED